MKNGIGMLASGVAGIFLGAKIVKKMDNPQIDRNKGLRELADKHFSLYIMMDQWVNIKQEGKNLSSYFEKNGYKRIAIYGMSYAGYTLYNELLNSDIEIAYFIEQEARKRIGLSKTLGLKGASMDDSLEEVDVMVVTPITFFEEISENLRKKIACPVVSLEEIIDEV